MPTKIEWAQESWNPITGCTPISEGCQNCYAARIAKRLAGRYGYPKNEPFAPATFHPDKIDINMFVPGKRIFVSSMSDLFHEKINLRGDEIRAHYAAIWVLRATYGAVYMDEYRRFILPDHIYKPPNL